MMEQMFLLVWLKQGYKFMPLPASCVVMLGIRRKNNNKVTCRLRGTNHEIAVLEGDLKHVLKYFSSNLILLLTQSPKEHPMIHKLELKS